MNLTFRGTEQHAHHKQIVVAVMRRAQDHVLGFASASEKASFDAKPAAEFARLRDELVALLEAGVTQKREHHALVNVKRGDSRFGSQLSP